ncbi:two-component system response regulator [Dyadobacter sp. NIV53]|uniref:response regulator n=1 Tax=Dyadobacter sp. NIV53 TaxID=2861765 RepID=UPI001C88A40C|nr:response regulator [Dyadobacter sp. NIV53]
MKISHRFIVVDDDSFNNLVCKYTILKYDASADIQLFTDPEKALAVIREEFGNITEGLDTVLFLDINMPIMSGWEFLNEFETYSQNIHRQITIYILSSSIDPGDKIKADGNTFVKGYYPKPLGIETMNQIFG